MGTIASLDMLLRAQYGVRTSFIENPLTQSVGTTVTRICRQNPKRVGLVIANLGATTLYIGPTPAVSSTNGLLLPGGGTTVTFRWDIDFDFVATEMHALSSAAGGVIYVLENYIQESL
jgi:hypothetical protein